MKSFISKGMLACSVMMGTTALLTYTSYAPQSWGCLAFSIWLLFAISKGWRNMQTADKNLLAWGWLSVAAFNCFTRADPSFKASLALQSTSHVRTICFPAHSSSHPQRNCRRYDLHSKCWDLPGQVSRCASSCRAVWFQNVESLLAC